MGAMSSSRCAGSCMRTEKFMGQLGAGYGEAMGRLRGHKFLIMGRTLGTRAVGHDFLIMGEVFGSLAS